jgi:hypothetical protein
MVFRVFLSGEHQAMVLVEAQPKTLERFARYRPPTVSKWIDRAET